MDGVRTKNPFALVYVNVQDKERGFEVTRGFSLQGNDSRGTGRGGGAISCYGGDTVYLARNLRLYQSKSSIALFFIFYFLFFFCYFRSESPSSANFLLDRDEGKTPPKKNKNETLPNCQTPPDQTPKDNTGFRTPTNTTPKKSSRGRTPTTDSSPEKKSAAEDTLTRVLRRRSSPATREDRMVESRQSRSSPRQSNSSNENESKAGDSARGKGLKEKRLSSEKTSDESSVKRTTRAKTRSTSPSPVTECSRRGDSSPSQEELIGQSTKTKLAEGKQKSLTQNAEKKRADVRARARQQDSSDESSGKENHDPESTAVEDNVTRSGLRSGAARVTQQLEEKSTEKNDSVESQVDTQKEPEENVQIESPKKTSLRSATIANLGEKGDRDDFREAAANIQDQPEQNSEMESPKRTRFRSAPEANLSEQCTENDARVLKSREDNVQEESKQDVEMESPKRKSLRSASKANPLEHCSETEDLIATRDTNVQKEPDQDVEMESPKRKSLRSAVKTNLPELSSENKDCGAEPQKGNKQEDSNQDSLVESSKRASLRSATRENVSEAQVQEKPEQDIEMESPKRKTLRSATKGNIPEPCCEGSSESKNLDSPKTEERKKRMRNSPVAKRPLDDSASTRGLKDNKTDLGDQQETMDTVQQDEAVRLTRSRVQFAPTSTTQSYNVSDVTEKRKSDVSSLFRNSTEEEHVERKVRSHNHSVGTAKRESQKSTFLSGANAGEVAKAADEHDAKQSSKCFSCGPDAVPEVKIKLSDCRQLCLTRARPVLETESDDSETESIQLSSGETLSKRSFSDNALSHGKDDNDNVSSTSTLEYCPSPASSEKSGLSDETESNRRYSLRKRSEHEDQDTCPRKTRSKNKIPDEDSKKGKQDRPERRRTVSSAYTNVKVKSRSPKKRSQSVTSPKKKAPVKRVKSARGMKSPLKKSPQGKTRTPEDPRSDSDSSTFSGSPQSGPISETKSTRASKAHSAVCNLEKSAEVDTEDAKETSLLSVGVVSVGDISTIAVCGSPPRLRPAQYTMTGKDTSLSGMKLLDGSPRIKKDFHSVSFLNKHRKQRAGIARLFESDDEEEDFIGFNVPQFDRSFSSEGDLSYKIDSILESMKGDDSHCIIEDDENTTVHEYEEVIMTENIGYETETDIERTEIANEGQCSEKVVEEDQVIKQVEATRMTRKRKSNQIDTVEVRRSIWFESQGELRSTAESEDVDDGDDGDDDEDFDEDDDVFSTVADSTDGEDEDEVASPFSISSWGRKRKSEDLQAPEIERPTKRRKSHEVTDTNHSSQSSKAETPIKSGANQEIRSQTDNKYQKSTSFMSRIDELQKSEQSEKDQYLSAKDSFSFCDSEEPVFLTIEERVKLRRIKNNSKNEQDNSQSLRQTKDHRKVDKRELAAKGKTDERLPTLKPLRKRTLKLLKPLTQVSPIRSSSRLSRTHSTPSPNPSALATPSGKPRRATWIYDASEFTSPPSAAPRYGGNRVPCSTPASTFPSSKRTLRPLRQSKMAEGSSQRKSRQRDVYAFDE